MTRIISAVLAATLIAAPAQAQLQSEMLRQAAQSPGEASQTISGVVDSTVPLHQRLQQAVKQIQIDEVVTIPIRSLKAIYSDGQLTYISENGRYALRGELIDVWQNKTLDTIDQVRDSVERLRFDNMGMPITDLNTLALQSLTPDAPVVNIFVDPHNAASKELISEARGLTDRFAFNFIVVPVLGPDSEQATKRISCARDRNAALQALEHDTISNLTVADDCDLRVFAQTLVAADLMGVNGVPFIVSPTGVIGRGRPDDLGVWLQEHMQ